jgi:hypothetical protein
MRPCSGWSQVLPVQVPWSQAVIRAMRFALVRAIVRTPAVPTASPRPNQRLGRPATQRDPATSSAITIMVPRSLPHRTSPRETTTTTTAGTSRFTWWRTLCRAARNAPSHTARASLSISEGCRVIEVPGTRIQLRLPPTS